MILVFLGSLAEHAHRRHLHPAVDPLFDHRPLGAGAIAEHHDPGRPGAGGRRAGGRCHRGTGEHAPQFGACTSRIRRAILDSASQIATPAIVSTLAICIVFVPVLFLTGPAASLFYPLALAVVFAILTSYLLSRTLVPTMMLYMLPAEVDALHRAPSAPADAAAGRSGSFINASIASSSASGSAYEGLLGFALEHRFSRSRDARLCRLLAGPGALARRGLFPGGRRRAVPAARPGPVRHARRRNRARLRQGRDVIREIVPASERAMILDNFGLTPSFTTRAYIDNGIVTDGDGEILVVAQAGPRADRGLRRAAAGRTAQAVPGLHVLLRAGRHHQPDPGLRPAGADRRAGGGRPPRGEPPGRQEALPRAGQDSRHRRRPHPADHRLRDAPHRRGPHPGVRAGPHAAERDRQRLGVAQRHHARCRPTTGSTRRTASTTLWPCRRPRIASPPWMP